MLRFFKPGDKNLFLWCGVIQPAVIKPLYSQGDFSASDIKNMIQFCFPIDKPISGPLFYVFRFRASNGNFYNVFCLLDQTSFQLKDMDINQQCVICMITEYYHPNVFEEILKIVRSLLLHSISTTEQYISGIINMNAQVITSPCLSDLLHECNNCVPNDVHLNGIIGFVYEVMTPLKIGRLITALLTDTPIIVISSDLSKLSRFCFSLIGLIYPLAWHHIFAPVLPVGCIDSVSSPAPFIVGLHRFLIPRAMNCDIESHILVDIDDGTISTQNLPNISPYANQLISHFAASYCNYGTNYINNNNSSDNYNYSNVTGNNNGNNGYSNGGSSYLREIRVFIISLVCACLGIQASNARSTTVKRINEALKYTRFDTNSFACQLLQSRTMRSFFDALKERTVPPDYAKMIALANTSMVTSLAIQNVDEFPIRKKGFVARSMSLQFPQGEKLPASASLPQMMNNKKKKKKSQLESDSVESSSPVVE